MIARVIRSQCVYTEPRLVSRIRRANSGSRKGGNVVFNISKKTQMIEPALALAGREDPLPLDPEHFINGHSMIGPFPEGTRQVLFAMGCFWGAERKFWVEPGVYVTAVGYTGGYTHNPTYEEVCSGKTGHTEAVLVVYDPDKVKLERLLQIFWQSHDPTQGMRQGNDIGTQYRSGIYTNSDDQHALAIATRDKYQSALDAAGYNTITTEVDSAGPFYYAETYHQQYLGKNPSGYCGLGGCGVGLEI